MASRDLTPERIVRLEGDAVVLLDQRRLPGEELELWCVSAEDVADAIRTLAIRGAPAIGVAAAYGLALAARRGEDLDAAYEVLAAARPTAVNLRWALDELRDDPTPELRRSRRRAPASRWHLAQLGSLRAHHPGVPHVKNMDTGSTCRLSGHMVRCVGVPRRAWREPCGAFRRSARTAVGRSCCAARSYVATGAESGNGLAIS